MKPQERTKTNSIVFKKKKKDQAKTLLHWVSVYYQNLYLYNFYSFMNTHII